MSVQRAFFYGTLMRPFNRPARRRIERHLIFVGRGHIAAALFDLGTYPAAVRGARGRVHGEVYEIDDPRVVFRALDEFEGYEPDEPDTGPYIRELTPVTLAGGRLVDAWAYFYNASVEGATPIASGDYLQYVKAR